MKKDENFTKDQVRDFERRGRIREVGIQCARVAALAPQNRPQSLVSAAVGLLVG